MKRIIQKYFILKILLLVSFNVWSGCSPYMGLASINEVSKRFQFLNNADDFVEIKKLDKTLNNNVLSGWNVSICETIFGIFVSCSGQMSLADATRTGKYWVYSGSPEPSSYIDWTGGFDIVLSDENGDVVDYLTVNGVDPQYEACPYPFPNTASGFNSTRRTSRSPDGVGDWYVVTGNSEPPTEGEDNAEDPPPIGAPSLSFDSDVVIGQGGTAQLTMVLDAAYTSDVVINYATVNGDATAGVDYSTSSGSITISAGDISTEVSVNTLVTGNTVDSYFFMTIESATNADVIDQVAKVTILQGTLADHFSISHSLNALTCEPFSVSISAIDVSGNILTSYQGTIQISTSSNNGDWSKVGLQTGFTPGISDSGVAQYQFSAADNGQVQLALSNTNLETLSVNILDTFNISETTGNATASDDEDITFREAVFRVLYDDGSALLESYPAFTAHKTITNNNVSNPLYLKAITTDKDTGECVSILNGDQDIELAIECVNPTSCDSSSDSTFLIDGEEIFENDSTITSYKSVTLSFSLDGTAILPNTRYRDAGNIRLHARKNLTDVTISGTSNDMISLPAGFCLEVFDANNECIGLNDNQWANCSVFKTAGELFSTRITAQGWQVNNDTNFCDNNARTRSFNESVSLVQNIIAPTGGNAGYLNTNSTILNLGTQSLDLFWSEMGVLSITMGGNSYLGYTLPTTISNAVGRFTPANFSLTKITDGSFNAANNGFTYTGQLTDSAEGAMGYDIVPQYTFQAVNALVVPDTLQNYIGEFDKSPQFSASIEVKNFGADGVTPLTAVGDFSTHNINYDSSTYTYSADFNLQDHFYIERTENAKTAPFTLNADINIDSFSDSDGINGNLLEFELSGSEIRYGRINIQNGYGSEQSEVRHSLFVEYFDGTTYQPNTLDINTDVDIANFYNFTVTNVGDSAQPLLVTDTTISGELFDTGTITAGFWGLEWTPPLNAHFGEIEFRYTASDWLKDNWDESVDNTEEDPSARVTFGRYRGNDRVIYWRELY